jgi:3-oxoacyl-[acyl-carrier protein] reductase
MTEIPASKQLTFSLQGRAALVTGASRGIGAAIALVLAGQGARVAVHYVRQEERAQELVARIRGQGGEAVALQAELLDVRAAAELVAKAAKALDGLDILINNAAIMEPAVVDAIADEQIDRTLAVNIRALVATTREFARLPRPEGRGGRIVNISSIAGTAPSGGSSLYAASKAAVNSLTRSHATELGARGITVNAVAPGTTETDMSSGFSDAKRQAIARGIALGRLGRPEEVANVVALLCTDAAGWVTGQIIGADGGMTTGAFALMKAAGVL